MSCTKHTNTWLPSAHNEIYSKGVSTSKISTRSLGNVPGWCLDMVDSERRSQQLKALTNSRAALNPKRRPRELHMAYKAPKPDFGIFLDFPLTSACD